MNLKDTRDFALAGRAIFTIQNEKTGNRFTFKVRLAPDTYKGQQTWFVSSLADSDNEGFYRYIGCIRAGTYRASNNLLTGMDRAYKAAGWFFPRLLAQHPLPPEVEVHHANRCGRCGRLLTTPESILRGLGPECAEKAMMA